MSYQVHNFQPGDVLLASQLNEMDNQIALNESSSASESSIANEFSTSSTYAVGDYVIYEGQLYQCTTAVTTAGSWNSSNWTQAVLGNDVSELKSAVDDLDSAVYAEIESINPLVYGGTNTAVTSNGDGTYTVGTSDYGNSWFGSPVTLKAGKYLLFGVSNGLSWVNTTASHSGAIATNDTNSPKEITISADGSYYVGFRMGSKPSSSFTIAPSLKRISVKADVNTDDIEVFKDTCYVLTPTGDTTNRRAEIESALALKKAVYFTPGEYTISDKLTMPNGTRLFGAGKNSVLKFGSGATGQMIECGNDCQIDNLKIDGGLSAKPDDGSANRHGVRVLNNAQTLQINDCWITGFGGSGVRIDSTGYAQLSSIQMVNCYFQYNGIGVWFLEHGEYGLVSNCSFIDNYMGAYLNGGNNILSGCALERNTTGATVRGNNIDNSGHGAFVGCSFNHNTYVGLEILATTNGYVVSGCQFFRNETRDFSTSSSGVNVVGCNFGISSKLAFSYDAIASFDGNMFVSQPTLTYTDNSKTKSANNWTFAGNPVNILRPGTRTFAPTSPGAMLTIIDDDGHSRFYTDLLPIIQSKKVPISTAIYNTSIGVASNTMTWEQVAECYENGAEILSHSYDHADTQDVQSMTLEEIQQKDQMAKNELLAKGYSGGKFLVYAGATQSVEKVVKAAKNVYSCGINSAGNVMNFIDTLDPYNLKRYRIESDYGYTSTALNGLIDDCVSGGGWMIWMIHTSANTWDTTAKTAISNAIDYAISQGLQIVTVEAGCRKMQIN